IISDTQNSRVLIYNSIPTTNNASANIVIGQTDMSGSSANQGGTADANTLNKPRGVYSDGTKLFVADYSNNRVLIYNSIPAGNNASADVAVGQLNKTGSTAVTAQNRTRAPYSVFVTGGKLLIAEYNSSRVLIFNSVPAADGANANVVVGQADWTSRTANQGGSAAANTLSNPMGVSSDGTKLIVSDTQNSRILIYNSIPAASNASADQVIGQPDMTSNSVNQGTAVAANNLYNPVGIQASGGKLFAADYGNNRVLVYNSLPSSDNADADVAVGQPNMTNNYYLQKGLASSSSMSFPVNFAVADGKLFITDSGNNRILIFNSVPVSSGAAADAVLGQDNLHDFSINQGRISPTEKTFWKPNGIFYDGKKFFVDEVYNRRVLIYNSLPSSSSAGANVEIGQIDFNHNDINQGGAAAANTFRSGGGLYSDGTKFIAVDVNNNRVLIYNSIPTTNNASADVVIGQSDMTGVTANQGGSVGANTTYYPYGLCSDGKKLVVTDYMNNRVLIYNSTPAANNASADVVIGQPDMTSNSVDQGSSAAANTLNYPVSAYCYDGRLLIGDEENNRILIYNSIPTSNNASADVVIGQPDMTSSSINQGGSSPSGKTLSYPFGTYIYDKHLYIADAYNHRVLIYNLGTRDESLSASSATNSRDIALALSATDAKDMMISENADFAGASWETYQASKVFTLSQGDGTKTVYAKFRDFANFEGSTVSQTVNLDSELPIIAIGNHKTYRLSIDETISTRNKTLVFRGKRDDIYRVELFEDGKLKKTSKINKKHNFRLRVKEKGRNETHSYQFKYYDSNNAIIHTSEIYNILFDKLKPRFTKSNPKTKRVSPGDTISWDVTDNDQIKYYEYVFQGKIHKMNQNSFTLPADLKTGKNWSLKVTAYDRAENRSMRRFKIKII
ncbi:MAG: hypothetical protein PHP25_05105, partial [Candidatus Moranbacteria bacterium]|nr:hypothetical protein [Candidatus Moranbacteria bacterium]